MYPLNKEQSYPRNQWWVAALASEVSRIPLDRTILGERVVMYRTEAGAPVALFGLCPHRHFPLVKGRLVGDELQCGYHGFKFNCEGRCTHIPSQSEIPGAFKTRSYPVEERGPWIWIWTGATDLADPALIPDIASIGLGVPGWRVQPFAPRTHSARYTLLIDNLLDLSHITFVHEKSIPGGAAVAALATELKSTPSTLRLRRIGKDAPPNGLDRLCFPDYDGLIDTVTDSEYFGPCLIKTGGARYASATDTQPAQLLGHLHFIHCITPETPHSTHYFVTIARDIQTDNPKVDHILATMDPVIGGEDIAVLELIEPGLDGVADTGRELSVRVDAGAIQVRRRLAAQIEQEILRG